LLKIENKDVLVRIVWFDEIKIVSEADYVSYEGIINECEDKFNESFIYSKIDDRDFEGKIVVDTFR